MYFALGWAASAHGGAMAALVLTAVNLPRTVLLLTAAAAGFLLPVVSLLNPLLAREHGWGAGAASLVAAAQAAGMITVSLVVTRRGAMSRIGIGAAAGLCVAALGIAGLSSKPLRGVRQG